MCSSDLVLDPPARKKALEELRREPLFAGDRQNVEEAECLVHARADRIMHPPVVRLLPLREVSVGGHPTGGRERVPGEPDARLPEVGADPVSE